MKMYEAAPSVWLCEGVTMEEHKAAMSGNYTGEADEYYERMWQEEQTEAFKQGAMAALSANDDRAIWVTKDRHAIPYAELEIGHLNNIVAFLGRSGIALAMPKLHAEWTRRRPEPDE